MMYKRNMWYIRHDMQNVTPFAGDPGRWAGEHEQPCLWRELSTPEKLINSIGQLYTIFVLSFCFWEEYNSYNSSNIITRADMEPKQIPYLTLVYHLVEVSFIWLGVVAVPPRTRSWIGMGRNLWTNVFRLTMTLVVLLPHTSMRLVTPSILPHFVYQQDPISMNILRAFNLSIAYNIKLCWFHVIIFIFRSDFEHI